LLDYILAPRCSRLRLEVTSDAGALLESCFALHDGIVLVAGTGSICLGAKHTRTGPVVSRAGGWGSYLDRGCGFRLGLGVLDAALRASEGRGDETPMTGLLRERYGLTPQEVPGRFLPVRREVVAGLAPIAMDAASHGDLEARKLVRGEIAALVDMVRAVAGRLVLAEPFRLVASGGLFEDRRVWSSFRRRLKRRLPGASVERIAVPLVRILGRHES
jgi:N-acetylglucosamine kinase-like BadF-type ATPase